MTWDDRQEAMTEAREKVERLQTLWRKCGARTEIESLHSWLLAHPAEAVAGITESQLSKYDTPIADVISGIGPPTANPCVPQLLGLLGDINWPVYVCAARALSRFSWSVVTAALAQLVNRREIEDVARFCSWTLYHEPSHVQEVRPSLVTVIAQSGHHEIDLEYARGVLAEIDEDLGKPLSDIQAS